MHYKSKVYHPRAQRNAPTRDEPLDPKASALTIRPLRLPQRLCYTRHFCLELVTQKTLRYPLRKESCLQPVLRTRIATEYCIDYPLLFATARGVLARLTFQSQLAKQFCKNEPMRVRPALARDKFLSRVLQIGNKNCESWTCDAQVVWRAVCSRSTSYLFANSEEGKWRHGSYKQTRSRALCY